jgi:hypothetical protein
MTEAEPIHALRPFLRNWVWEHGRVGTRYLDCLDGQLKFDEGKKARFASEKYFFVSLKKDGEAASHGAAPAVHEAGLARLLRAAQLGRPEEAGSPGEVQRAVHDCVELALASAYQHEARQALAKYSLEPMFEDEIREAVIDEVRARHVGMREQLMLYDFTVFHGLPQPLMISESPFIDWRVKANGALPLVSMPLGPYSVLAGTPSTRTSRAAPTLWKPAPAMGPFKDHNRFLVERARLWLVATTDEQLAAVQKRFEPPAPPEGEAPAG